MKPIRTPLTKGTYGAPRGMEAEIGGLPFWRDVALGSTVVSSVWEPTEEERRALAAGANVVLGIYGMEPIPPVSLQVMSGKPWQAIEALEESREAAQAVPSDGDGVSEWNAQRRNFWCQMCGAAPGEDCTVISGTGQEGDRPGDRRSVMHHHRSAPNRPGVLVPDEPPPTYADPQP